MLQTLFMINPFVKIVTETNISASPIQELASIFQQIIKHQDNHGTCNCIISTKELTKSLGRKWTSMQGPIDTYEFLMKRINENLTSMELNDMITNTFCIECIVRHKITRKQYSENWFSFNFH